MKNRKSITDCLRQSACNQIIETIQTTCLDFEQLQAIREAVEDKISITPEYIKLKEVFCR